MKFVKNVVRKMKVWKKQILVEHLPPKRIIKAGSFHKYVCNKKLAYTRGMRKEFPREHLWTFHNIRLAVLACNSDLGVFMFFFKKIMSWKTLSTLRGVGGKTFERARVRKVFFLH